MLPGVAADADAAARPGPLGESADEPPESVFTPVASDAAEQPRSEHPGSSAAGYGARGDERPELPGSTARVGQSLDERPFARESDQRYERTPSLVPPRGAFEPAAPGTTESTPRGTHDVWADGTRHSGMRDTGTRDTGTRDTGTRDTGIRGGAGGPGGRPPGGQGPGSGQGRVAPQMAADGSWAWGPASLTRDQLRVAEDAYDRFRAAEGRSLFGGYGGYGGNSGNGLTPAMRRVEEQLAHARLAPDTEERALLEPDLFRARLADMLRRHPDRTPEQLGRRVPGALSYVFILEAEHYAEGIRGTQEALEIQGFQLQARKNSWNSAVNRCVFTIWHDPRSDLPFQVQFHTAASLEAQHLARSSATLINDPRIPSAEAASIRSEIASAWAALPVPPGNADIADYRRAGDVTRR